MPEPLISICVPVYNGEKYLKECLDSCIHQSFNNYEIVVCDDGSTDSSSAIIDEYIQKGHQIRFYKNANNLGLVGNWNKCLALAAGKWIKFLFQDDTMTADCLQVFYGNIRETSWLMICQRNFILDKNATQDKIDYYTNTVRTLENTGHYNAPQFSASTISKIAAANISLNFIGEPSLAFFKKELAEYIGIFDPELKQICDLEFFLRVASNFGLIYIPKQLCEFRIHDNSTTEKNISGKDYRLNFLETLNFALKLMSKTQFSNFRKSLNPFELLKLKWFIKYKSYVAFTAIASKKDAELFNALKQNYRPLFFKQHERIFLQMVKKIQTKRMA